MLVKFIYGNPFGPFTTLDCYSDFWCSEAVKQGDGGVSETIVDQGKHKYHKAGVLRTLLNKGNPSCNVKAEQSDKHKQVNTKMCFNASFSGH